MALLDLIGGPLISLGKDIIDRVIPDPAQKAEAQLKLLQMEQTGELEQMKTSMSAIIAEANSPDPWTSRARPSFLYVMYIVILSSIPMGLVAAWNPDLALHIETGMTHYLASIPDSLWTLFGAGYLGYVGSRTYEKGKGVTK